MYAVTYVCTVVFVPCLGLQVSGCFADTTSQGLLDHGHGLAPVPPGHAWLPGRLHKDYGLMLQYEII